MWLFFNKLLFFRDSDLDEEEKELPQEDLIVDEESYLTQSEKTVKHADEWYSRVILFYTFLNNLF